MTDTKKDIQLERWNNLKALPPNSVLKMAYIGHEQYREYEQPDGYKYRINLPVAMLTRQGGTPHRIVDVNGLAHCVPVGPSTVIRWLNHDLSVPVSF